LLDNKRFLPEDQAPKEIFGNQSQRFCLSS